MFMIMFVNEDTFARSSEYVWMVTIIKTEFLGTLDINTYIYTKCNQIGAQCVVIRKLRILALAVAT
jgi:hypothetical protein